MLELLFLLLPVAAGYGWVMGRNSVRQQQHKTSRILSKHYFKGLNFLLSDQPDKAVDTLIKMVDVNSDSAETNIAMGSFFRHRGEIDRAIKIHQNLVEKSNLPEKLKEKALFELGRDYLLAGFLERAENAFIGLLDSDKFYQQAHQQLFNIYQTTKEWDRALELAENIDQESADEELNLRISHFYCEKAQKDIREGDAETAEVLLNKAIEADAYSVRPWLLLADSAIKSEQYNKAFEFLKEIPIRDVDWFSEAVPDLVKCTESTQNWEPLKQLLNDYSTRCATAYLAKVSLMARDKSAEEAADFLLEQLKQSPSMKGFHKLLSLYADKNQDDAETKQSLELLQDLIEAQINQRPKYRCHNCGFSGRKVHWLCPSCKKWGTMKPIKGLDGE